MTFTRTLKAARIGQYNIEATQNTEKFCVVPYYQIIVSVDGIATEVINAARTTWSRKFKAVCKDYEAKAKGA